MPIWPRRSCPVCSRDTAVMPSGRLMRHDPAHRARTEGAPLVSCTGSLRVAPMKGGVQLQIALELDEENKLF